MKWINVNDRLPEDEERVAILYHTTDSKKLRKFIGEYVPNEERWVNTLSDTIITYWMPLPEPPEGEE
jgi:hypothetical protein